MNRNNQEDTIVALATAEGKSAIAVIRISGAKAVEIVQKVFTNKKLSQARTHSLLYGTIKENSEVIDEVVISVFKAPNSFTREDVVEISCHGSLYIIKKIIHILISYGCRYAEAGEFTKRAFLNGRFDLTQAEAVADLISAESDIAHKIALNQMRDGFMKDIMQLRKTLIHFASMIELELDFSEEDVQFANRNELRTLIETIITAIKPLIKGFDQGNIIKNGIQTVIIGIPNAGKSTLLNAIINEEKAIVSPIPGTTRDLIEETIHIDGIMFRFIDTAGLRESADTIESMGIEKTKKKMQEASLILYIFDLVQERTERILEVVQELTNEKKKFIPIGNKVDECSPQIVELLKENTDFVFISALKKQGLEHIKEKMKEKMQIETIQSGKYIFTNSRHYEKFTRSLLSLQQVLTALDEKHTSDILAFHLKDALSLLGEVSGEITNEEVLRNIFSSFCIGK